MPFADHIVDRSRDPVLAPGERLRPAWRALLVSAALVGSGLLAGLALGLTVGCGGCSGALLAALGRCS